MDRNAELTVRRQCELLGLARSSFYFVPQNTSPRDIETMKKIDRIYTEFPFYGCRRIAYELGIDKDYANRLMRLMGIEAIYPKPSLSRKNPEHKVFPYLLRGLEIVRPRQVYSTDITYVPLRKGFAYLSAVIDWFSRCVLSWKVSNTMDTDLCVSVTRESFESCDKPEIFILPRNQNSVFQRQQLKVFCD